VETKERVELKVALEDVPEEPKRTLMITYVVEFLDGRKSYKTIYITRKGKLNIQFFEELRIKLLSEEKERWEKAIEDIEKIQNTKVPRITPFNVAIIFVMELEE
jgi:hypothetical protein